MNESTSPKSKGIPKIGKRGWCGVVMVAIGLMTYFGAHKDAENIVQTNYENGGVEKVAGDDALAQAAGHGSYSDYLEEQNHKSGLFFMGVGAFFIFWGHSRYNPNDASPTG